MPVRQEFLRLYESTERIRVYRVSATAALDNRNAGTLEAVVDHIASSFERDFSIGDKLFVHDVTVTLPYGQYVMARGTVPSNPSADKQLVGRMENGGWAGPSYFFPAGSPMWSSSLVKQIDLGSFMIQCDHLASTPKWAAAGSVEQVQVAKRVLGL